MGSMLKNEITQSRSRQYSTHIVQTVQATTRFEQALMLLDEKVPVLLFTLINFSKTTEIMYIKEWIQKDFSTVEAYMSTSFGLMWFGNELSQSLNKCNTIDHNVVLQKMIWEWIDSDSTTINPPHWLADGHILAENCLLHVHLTAWAGMFCI